MKIERIWGYPSKNTFSIKPIKKLLREEVTGSLWIDPFANNAKVATASYTRLPFVTTGCSWLRRMCMRK